MHSRQDQPSMVLVNVQPLGCSFTKAMAARICPNAASMCAGVSARNIATQAKNNASRCATSLSSSAMHCLTTVFSCATYWSSGVMSLLLCCGRRQVVCLPPEETLPDQHPRHHATALGVTDPACAGATLDAASAAANSTMDSDRRTYVQFILVTPCIYHAHNHAMIPINDPATARACSIFSLTIAVDNRTSCVRA